MADRDPAELSRENAYLKQRNAQLQSDITDLAAEVERLRRIQDRLHGRAAMQTPGAPASSQPSSAKRQAGPADAQKADVEAAAPFAGATDERVAADYGVAIESIACFRVGGYRYTSLKEAIAEAKRQRTLA